MVHAGFPPDADAIELSILFHILTHSIIFLLYNYLKVQFAVLLYVVHENIQVFDVINISYVFIIKRF